VHFLEALNSGLAILGTCEKSVRPDHFSVVLLIVSFSTAVLCIPSLDGNWCVSAELAAVSLTFHYQDTAKDIYRNITLEKVALIRFILEQQKPFAAARQNWERSFIVGTIR
jgi:hypothetical protein